MSKLNKLIATLSISLYALTHTHAQFILSPKIIDDNTKSYLPTSAQLGQKSLNTISIQSINNLPDTLYLFHPHYKIHPRPLLQYPHNFQKNYLNIEAHATPYISAKYTRSFVNPDKPKKLAKGTVSTRLITDIPKPQKATLYNANHKKIATLKLSPLDQKLYTRSTTYATKIPHHKLQDGYIVIQKDTFPISKDEFFQPIYCISAHKGTIPPNQLDFAKKYFTDYTQKQSQYHNTRDENNRLAYSHTHQLNQLYEKRQSLHAQLQLCRLNLEACLKGEDKNYAIPPLPPLPPVPEEVFVVERTFLSFYREPQPRGAVWHVYIPEAYAQKRSGEVVIGVNVAADGKAEPLIIYAAPDHLTYAQTVLSYLQTLSYDPAQIDGTPVNSAFLLHIYL